MKKIFTFCVLMATMLSTNMYATYYIAGNCEAFGSWGPNIVALNAEDQISFSQLPTGSYEFKITNGNWGDKEGGQEWGFSQVDAEKSSPMYNNSGDNNIHFYLQTATDVTVKMVNDKVVLLIDREYSITGNGAEVGGGAWLAGQNWWSKNDDARLDGNFSRTYYNLPAATYKFRIKVNVDVNNDAINWYDDCTWGYNHLDTEHSITCSSEGDAKNICFTLARPGDVTIALVNNRIRVNANAVYFVAGNGDEDNKTERGTWCNQKDWAVADAQSRLDPSSLSKTYTSLPAGIYEFKITNGNWGSGNEWSIGAVDSETSSPGYYDKEDVNHNHNIGFDLVGETDVTITFNPETEKITLISSKGYFGESNPTALENVTLKNNGKYYDVLGREIANPQKGNLYIHNGKKVIF